MKTSKEQRSSLLGYYKFMLKASEEKSNYIIVVSPSAVKQYEYINKLEIDSLMLLYYIEKHIEIYRNKCAAEYAAKNENGRPLRIVDGPQIINIGEIITKFDKK